MRLSDVKPLPPPKTYADPLDAVRELLTYDDVVDAIDVKDKWGDETRFGLCYRFNLAHPGKDMYQLVPRMLNALGGVPDGFDYWPCTATGQRKREVFLAFLLTWLDDT